MAGTENQISINVDLVLNNPLNNEVDPMTIKGGHESSHHNQIHHDKDNND